MSETNSNNKRILKNTVFLYFRMFLVMAVSLFTSRIILKNLGVEDFGIYNVVGGVVSMMAVVNTTMAVATQRYLTFSLGKDDVEGLQKVFSTSMLIYVLLSFVLVVLSETIGLWWINNVLIIPHSRLSAANWVFQFAVVSCIMSLLTNPYNAAIIAHEKMDYYAYLSIIEVLLKFTVAYILSIVTIDRLNTYGFLLMIVQAIILIMYYAYCKHCFKECSFRIYKDKTLFLELLSYSGWNLFGAFAGVAKGQGINILLNCFYGPAVNAARGIAYQINAVVSQFFTNFYTAVKPQLTKYYAQEKYDEMIHLVFQSARMSFYLILFISLPIMIETPMVIELWLNTEIDYVVSFTRLIILISAVDAMATPLMTLMHATGKIKLYQIIIGLSTISILPISYVFIKYFHCNPNVVFYISLSISVFCMFARLYLVNREVSLPIKRYILDVFIQCAFVATISAICPVLLYLLLQESVSSFFVVCFVSLLSSFLTIYIIGLQKSEREIVTRFILNFVFKFKNK